jgi:hypothetical protein
VVLVLAYPISILHSCGLIRFYISNETTTVSELKQANETD